MISASGIPQPPADDGSAVQNPSKDWTAQQGPVIKARLIPTWEESGKNLQSIEAQLPTAKWHPNIKVPFMTTLPNISSQGKKTSIQA